MAALAAGAGVAMLEAPGDRRRPPRGGRRHHRHRRRRRRRYSRTHRPALEAMGGEIFHVGPLGKAAVIKVITNMLAFIHLLATGEALMLAKTRRHRSRAGLPRDQGEFRHQLRPRDRGPADPQRQLQHQFHHGSRREGPRLCARTSARHSACRSTWRRVALQTFIRARPAYGGSAMSTQAVKLLEDAMGTDLRAPGFPAELAADAEADPMKSHARVVIVGGGIMGVGLLYHLALEGWTDVVLIEKGELTSGSTWHAAGQCPHFNSLAQHDEGACLWHASSIPKLEALTGQAVSWHGCGGLRLATTDEEVDWLKYVHGVSRLAGYEGEIIGPDEISAIPPVPRHVRRESGLPHRARRPCRAGRRHQRHGGRRAQARRRDRTAARALPTSSGCRAANGASSPTQGDIVCEHVVNAAGSYADVVGAWTGHSVPIANMLHHYLITEPLRELIDLAPGTAGSARSLFACLSARGDQRHADRPL